MLGIVTGSTCGDSCWYAIEDICHCSCGGANHGCLRSEKGVQPIRTAKVDGEVCELRAVGYYLDKQAQAINKANGTDYVFAHTARTMFGAIAYAKMRKATEAQVKRWPELAAYRQNIQDVWREANPTGTWRDYPGLPYLLWVVKGTPNVE